MTNLYLLNGDLSSALHGFSLNQVRDFEFCHVFFLIIIYDIGVQFIAFFDLTKFSKKLDQDKCVQLLL